MDTNVLPQCPFCGSRDISSDGEDTPELNEDLGECHMAYCESCGAHEPTAGTEEEAITAWKGRAALPSDAAQAPHGWRMRMDADEAIVVQKDGIDGAMVTAKDEEIAGAILYHLVRDILAAPVAPASTKHTK